MATEEELAEWIASAYEDVNLVTTAWLTSPVFYTRVEGLTEEHLHELASLLDETHLDPDERSSWVTLMAGLQLAGVIRLLAQAMGRDGDEALVWQAMRVTHEQNRGT